MSGKSTEAVYREHDYTTMYFRSIPVDVKKKFKVKCAQEGVSMTDKIVDLMRQAYQSNKPVQ